MSEKQLMLGNEAVARGAWEAGAAVVASYPGTPSTEITEFCAKYPDLNVEWAVNEKVALEIAFGAAMGGVRALSCCKHVGLNVAADPLFTAAYTGVRGGLVVVVADDPGMHSSQNEQDSRYYALSAHIPMLVPSDAQECKDFIKFAFELSEQYDTPVLVGTCTRIAHARSPVTLEDRAQQTVKPWAKDPQKYVMMPAMARGRHAAVEAREARLAEAANDLPIHRVEWADRSLGVVCAGTAYQYVKEALPSASVLKLGMVHPLPEDLIRSFADGVERLLIIEEMEPFLEDQLRAMGIACEGKALTGRQGELSVPKLRKALGLPSPATEPKPLPARPPVMCPGCPHRGTFYAISKRKLRVFGDIGCYTLGALAPLNAMDACLCMGASIGMAFGAEKAQGKDFSRQSVAVIGDSTFLHSGMTGLLDAVYNGGSITVLILDNRITGMTGHQQNPASGFDIHGNPAPQVDLTALVRALGVEHVREVDAFDLTGLDEALAEETARDAVSVLIVRRACALLDKRRKAPLAISGCRNCGMCMKLGCPALVRGEKGVSIEPTLCVGCGLCAKVCRFGAIKGGEEQ